MAKEYMVVLLTEDGEDPVRDPYSYKPRIWNDGKAAADCAKQWSAYGSKYQVRDARPADENWRKREEDRLASGEYVKIPWADDAEWIKHSKRVVDHFLHVAKDDPTKVAYTDGPEKGKRDIQTRMLPSKYLSRFYGGAASEANIRKWCAAHRKLYGCNYELKFATKEEDILHVFREGPNSCMSGVRSTRAYADSDLAIAYIESKDKNGVHISARCVVWPEKKLYCAHIYGDVHLMRDVLQDEGYSESYRFKGARIKAIKTPRANPVKRPGCEGMLQYKYNYELPSIEMADNGLDYEEDWVVIR